METLLGPPQVVKDPEAAGQTPTIRKAMENEHTTMKDSKVAFTSSNGCTTDAHTEWEFVYQPQPRDGGYPDRIAYAHEHAELRRKAIPISAFLAEGGLLETEVNSKLREGGHSEVILEEITAGRLYVRRACTGDA